MKFSMNIYCLLVIMLMMPGSAYAVDWDDKEEATEIMSRCSAVYSYLMNLSLIEGNQTAAKHYLSRATTFNVGNMFLNREGEVVPGERLESIKRYSIGMREEHDANRNLLLKRADDCRDHQSMVIRKFGNSPKLFGKTFQEMNAALIDQIAKQVGIF